MGNQHIRRAGVRYPAELAGAGTHPLPGGSLAAFQDVILAVGSSLDPATVLQRRCCSHADWREANEFMHGCSTNWGAYLTSLKPGAEHGEFAAYPAGEMSRWS
jgi:hypothetical protein